MLRYKLLIARSLDPDAQKPLSLRELSKEIKIPVPSLHNYKDFDTLPRIENVEKMATYYGESISSLFSEDDDLTANLVKKIRALSDQQKTDLLQDLTHGS